MSVGERLKAARVRADKTSLEVSRAIGVSRSAIQMYEADMRVPRDDIKRKLAEFYGISIQDLFF